MTRTAFFSAESAGRALPQVTGWPSKCDKKASHTASQLHPINGKHLEPIQAAAAKVEVALAWLQPHDIGTKNSSSQATKEFTSKRRSSGKGTCVRRNQRLRSAGATAERWSTGPPCVWASRTAGTASWTAGRGRSNCRGNSASGTETWGTTTAGKTVSSDVLLRGESMISAQCCRAMAKESRKRSCANPI